VRQRVSARHHRMAMSAVISPQTMPQVVSATAHSIVGRDPELEAIELWVSCRGPALLEIEGEAGIGKTVLWEEGVRRARDAGALVLVSRPAELETAVSYGALASLLEPALDRANGSVPAPRRRALEGALRLRDVPVSRLDETSVALGASSVLRAVARTQRVVVAVEDVQWLDLSSRVALTYALRSLQPDDDVGVLLTGRLESGPRLDLLGTAVGATHEVLRPGPLSLGALHRLVRERLGRPLSRPKLVRVHAASRGNPFHALELARVVCDASPGEQALSIPASLGETLRTRIAALSRDARTLLLAVAAAGETDLDMVARAFEPLDLNPPLDEALEHGVLLTDRGTVRFSHPLLASTVYGDAPETARQRIHARLATLALTAEARARHLALAGVGPDESVAAALAEVAASACLRGARSAGAALFEQAVTLTPAEESEACTVRMIRAARAHFESGEADRARVLLEDAAGGESAARFEALCVLGMLEDETVGGDASLPIFGRVLASDDPLLRARAHRGLAQALAYVGDLERALGHADAAVCEAQRAADPAIAVYALAMQALIRKMAGRVDWREPLERGLALEARIDVPDLDGCASAFHADTLRLELELEDARLAYGSMLGRTLERGDVPTECWCQFGLASVEIAAGRWPEAAEHAEQLTDLAEQTRTFRLPALRTNAHLAVLQGSSERARALLATAIAEAEPSGELHNLRSAQQLTGLLELSLGDPAAALPPLRRAREIAEQMALGEPAMLTFLLDEVEAHALTGDAASAAAVLMAFDRRCEPSTSPWISPLALRARGLVEAVVGDLETARATLEAAVAAENDVPLPLERARTRLVLGRVLRRLQHRARAQSELAEALARFETLGAPLWADRAREELARIGGRAASNDDLTPTELRIAELVGGGMTNREVAATVFVTPKTVESALTRVYRKLGVRSRTELARRLGGETKE
jgi:DNA-binding CsgD family transcriptional regulator/tetratricopeptide (TPR) repeat protein